MVNHPNRSRSMDAPGRSPKPEEVRALREEMGLTQADFGRMVYRTLRSVQDWEGGLRRCPADTWEYLNLLHRYAEVQQARQQWLQAGKKSGQMAARIAAKKPET